MVLDAGAGGDSTVWRSVEPEVARFAHVCVYDRANRGPSDPGPIPNTRQRMVSDLRTLLTRISCSPTTARLATTGESSAGRRGKLVVVERSGHNIHQERPDVVIAAIREVVERVRR